MELLTENDRWELNIHLNDLTVQQRKNAMVLLFFLNTYGNDELAFEMLKKHWINNIYKLPPTSTADYETVKKGRYVTLKTMKNIYDMYVEPSNEMEPS